MRKLSKIIIAMGVVAAVCLFLVLLVISACPKIGVEVPKFYNCSGNMQIKSCNRIMPANPWLLEFCPKTACDIINITPENIKYIPPQATLIQACPQ